MSALIVPGFSPPVGHRAKPPVRARVGSPFPPRARTKASGVHRTRQLDVGRAIAPGFPTGHAALDLRLPGGGWPRRSLTELSLRRPGSGEMDLLAPCLLAVQSAGGLVMLFDPPPCLSQGRLVRLGLDPALLLMVETACLQDDAPEHAAGSRLWAMEQALRGGQVGAVVAWLPAPIGPEGLLRLQRAVLSHDGPAFVLHEAGFPMPPGHPGPRLVLREGVGTGVAVQLLGRRAARPVTRFAPVSGIGARAVPGPGSVCLRQACIDIPPIGHANAFHPNGLGDTGPGRPVATFVNLA